MQSNFKRYEEKYIITPEQSVVLKNILTQHMEPDRYGEYLVQNLYYDTENWDVVRTSIEKPVYKEKMRLRCYGVPDKKTNVFLELKKKYKEIVYKRRIAIPHQKLSMESVRDIVSNEISQISKELDFYLKVNAVSEKVYISYQRAAFTGVENKALRVTFDTNVRFRTDDLNFFHPEDGCTILPHDKMIMEIKNFGEMPLWMARTLSEYAIYPTPFSKLGACYVRHILKPLGRERRVLISA